MLKIFCSKITPLHSLDNSGQHKQQTYSQWLILFIWSYSLSKPYWWYKIFNIGPRLHTLFKKYDCLCMAYRNLMFVSQTKSPSHQINDDHPSHVILFILVSFHHHIFQCRLEVFESQWWIYRYYTILGDNLVSWSSKQQ